MPTSRFQSAGYNLEDEDIGHDECREYTDPRTETTIRIYCSEVSPVWAGQGTGKIPDDVKKKCKKFIAPAIAAASRLVSGSTFFVSAVAIVLAIVKAW